MANRYTRQFVGCSIPGVSEVFASITFGSSGAPTLSTGSSFISSVVRNSAGDYTITLRDQWSALLNVQCVFNSGSSLPAAPAMNIKANNVAATAKTLQIVFSDLETPAATDPASGEIVYLRITLKNSSVTY